MTWIGVEISHKFVRLGEGQDPCLWHPNNLDLWEPPSALQSRDSHFCGSFEIPCDRFQMCERLQRRSHSAQKNYMILHLEGVFSAPNPSFFKETSMMVSITCRTPAAVLDEHNRWRTGSILFFANSIFACEIKCFALNSSSRRSSFIPTRTTGISGWNFLTNGANWTCSIKKMLK